MLTLIAIALAVFVLPSPWGVIAVVTAALVDVVETGVFWWWSKRRAPRVGAETLIGRSAVVVRAVAPGQAQVKLDGELWAATGDDALESGANVTVTAVDGLTLTVEATPPK